ncbi:GNAT family N-acetyltransferase [Streptomyces sp. NPDC001941]|uniref:GNAT family N-acetyltransferase n=1 Tax=Streptomyces sp. NPDC001941 TaxID=3154659 RepID=UPI00332BE961
MLADTVGAWVGGWAASREHPRPLGRPWGWYVEVGRPAMTARHVVGRPAREAALEAVAAASGPYVVVTVPGEPDEVAGWLPGDWRVNPEQCFHLMTVDLDPGRPRTPEGYRLGIEVAGEVVRALVTGPRGQEAARGQMAVHAGVAVFDQVITEPEHRRRGLGVLMMRALADHAVGTGARTGALGATDEGRALYESLGWKRGCALVNCVRRAAA